MKARLRIKIMQEETKAKNIRCTSLDMNKIESYKLRKARKNIDNKIKFYKLLSNELEKRSNSDNI